MNGLSVPLIHRNEIESKWNGMRKEIGWGINKMINMNIIVWLTK